MSSYGGGKHPKVELRRLGVMVDSWTFASADNLTGYDVDFPPVDYSLFGPTQDPQRLYVTRFAGMRLVAKLTLAGFDNEPFLRFIQNLRLWRGEVWFYPAPDTLTFSRTTTRDYWKVNAILPDVVTSFRRDESGNVRHALGHDVVLTLEGYEEMTEPPGSNGTGSPDASRGRSEPFASCGGDDALKQSDSTLAAIIGHAKFE